MKLVYKGKVGRSVGRSAAFFCYVALLLHPFSFFELEYRRTAAFVQYRSLLCAVPQPLCSAAAFVQYRSLCAVPQPLCSAAACRTAAFVQYRSLCAVPQPLCSTAAFVQYRSLCAVVVPQQSLYRAVLRADDGQRAARSLSPSLSLSFSLSLSLPLSKCHVVQT